MYSLCSLLICSIDFRREETITLTLKYEKKQGRQLASRELGNNQTCVVF